MYDVIVIGRNIGSLIAALATARFGLSTILVSEGDLLSEHREAGYCFPVDPMPLSGFGEGQAVDLLLEELNLPRDGFTPHPPLDPALQIILPKNRLDLYRDPDRLIRDVIREFPQREKEIRRYYHHLAIAESLLRQWISVDDGGRSADFKKRFRELMLLPKAIACRTALSRNLDDQTLRQMILSPCAVLSHLDCSHRSMPLSSVHSLALSQRGIFDPYVRIDWMSWLCHEFTAAGGVLMESCSVIRIDSKPQIIVDVEGKGPSVSLRGKKLIVHVQWEKLRLLLAHEKSFRRVEKKLDAFPPSLFPFSLHLGVHEGGLPESLAPCAIIVPDIMATAVDPHPLLLVSSPLGDTGRAPEGKRAITLTKYLKKSPLTMADAELREAAQEMLTSLDGFLPFLRESIDYVNIEKSIELSRQSQEIVSPSYVPRQGAIIGLTTFPHETALNHVFLNGGILKAGLGFEGELLAALEVARTVRMEIKKIV